MSDKELDETITMLTKEKQKRAKCVKVIFVGATQYEFLDKERQPIDSYEYRYAQGDIVTYRFDLFSNYNLCDEVKLRCSVGTLVTIYERIIKVLYEKGYILKYINDHGLVFVKKCLS